MNQGKTIFTQLMEFLPPRYEFNKSIEPYGGERTTHSSRRPSILDVDDMRVHKKPCELFESKETPH